ncbi:MAG: TetR/AcrR family transcriptional regulator [Acidobacteriota bacterium]
MTANTEHETRERIVGAAMQLFWEKGYNATSVADILKSAGINSGSLYHFFPGKQDVLLAVLTALHDNIWQWLLTPAWEGIPDPVERIFKLLDRYRASLIETGFTYGCPIGSLALELHEPDPPVREKLAQNFDNWVAAVEGCLDEARKRFPPRTNRHEVALFVLTTMEGGVMLARTEHSIEPFDACVDQLRNYLNLLMKSAKQTKSRK